MRLAEKSVQHVAMQNRLGDQGLIWVWEERLVIRVGGFNNYDDS